LFWSSSEFDSFTSYSY